MTSGAKLFAVAGIILAVRSIIKNVKLLEK